MSDMFIEVVDLSEGSSPVVDIIKLGDVYRVKQERHSKSWLVYLKGGGISTISEVDAARILSKLDIMRIDT